MQLTLPLAACVTLPDPMVGGILVAILTTVGAAVYRGRAAMSIGVARWACGRS